MPPRKRKSSTPTERKAASKRQRLSHMWLRLQRENTLIYSPPPRNPATASDSADSPSATRNNSVSNPANGRSAQLPIRTATVITPVPPTTERRLRQYRHLGRRRMGLDSVTPDVSLVSPALAVCHCEPIRRTVPVILNEGTANLAPSVILNQIISDNLHAICRGVASKYNTLANHPHAKASHKLFKNNLSKWTRCYFAVCKEYNLESKQT